MIAELVTGFGELLDSNSVGVWDPTSVIGADQVAIVAQDVPTKPDQLIILSGYAVQDDPTLNDSVIGMQVRFRGSRADRMTLLDRSAAVFDLVTGIPDTTLNGVTVVTAWRQGGGWIGRDDLLRWEYADTYYWRVAWPTRYRTD